MKWFHIWIVDKLPTYLWTESRRGGNYFLVFIWINYIDLPRFVSLHQAYSLRIQCKNKRKQKENKKNNPKTIMCSTENPSFSLLLDNILYIYIYTVCVYFCHSYKNKIRYCRCATLHTRWKQNTEKLYSPHWGQRYTRLFKKKSDRKRRKELYRL